MKIRDLKESFLNFDLSRLKIPFFFALDAALALIVLVILINLASFFVDLPPYGMESDLFEALFFIFAALYAWVRHKRRSS